METGDRVIDNEDGALDEDSVMLDALEAGAGDIECEDSVFAVTTSPERFGDVRQALEEKGYRLLSAQVEMVPQNYMTLEDETARKKMEKLLEMFEDLDDVQNVWHNWE